MFQLLKQPFLRPITNNPHTSALILVILIIFTSHTLYLLNTHQFPEMDEQHYMYMTSGFQKLLQNPSWSTPFEMLELIPFRQPGYSFLILPFTLAFGLEHIYQWGLFVNGILYSATIAATYFLAKEFFQKTTALTSAIIFTFYGWTLFYLHFTYSETAVTAFVTLSLLFLKKSNNLTIRKHAILFAVTFGYALFTRWVSAIFLAGPLILTAYFITTLPVKEKTKSLKNIIILIIIGILPASTVYIINYENFFGQYVSNQLLGGPLWEDLPANRRSHISLQSAAYFPKVFAQLTIFFFTLFLSGLLICLLKWKKTAFLLSALIFAYLAFSFATIIKDDRYIVPIYPILAIISASLLQVIKNKHLKAALIIIIVALSTLYFLGASWGIGPAKTGLKSITLNMPIGHPRQIHFTPVTWPPKEENTNVHKLFKTIEQNAQENNIQNPKILQLFSYHPVDIGIYSTNTYTRLKPLEINHLVGSTAEDSKATSNLISSLLLNSDYILTKNINTTDNYFPENNYTLLLALNNAIANTPNFFSSYKIIDTITIPVDQSKVTIYRKTSQIPRDTLDQIISVTQDQTK